MSIIEKPKAKYTRENARLTVFKTLRSSKKETLALLVHLTLHYARAPWLPFDSTRFKHRAPAGPLKCQLKIQFQTDPHGNLTCKRYSQAQHPIKEYAGLFSTGFQVFSQETADDSIFLIARSLLAKLPTPIAFKL